MTSTVSITTGARLHFGPLSYRPESGRHFGGVGLMITSPGCHLTLRKTDTDEVTGEAAAVGLVRRFLTQARERWIGSAAPPPCSIHVERSIPLHSGLGSGTQLGMAVARGLAELSGRHLPAEELARCVERGRRSAIGLHGFDQGGLIVDAGQRTKSDLGLLACRLAFPDDWRILLLTPEREKQGLFGQQEEQAFELLGSMPAVLTDQLCRLVLTELLPAVGIANFESFCDAVAEYGRRVGDFFRPVQGGIFGDVQTDAFVGRLEKLGLRGLGQTSWGPTLFAFVSSATEAQSMAALVSSEAESDFPGCSVNIVRPLNGGAIVEFAT